MSAFVAVSLVVMTEKRCGHELKFDLKHRTDSSESRAIITRAMSFEQDADKGMKPHEVAAWRKRCIHVYVSCEL